MWAGDAFARQLRASRAAAATGAGAEPGACADPHEPGYFAARRRRGRCGVGVPAAGGQTGCRFRAGLVQSGAGVEYAGSPGRRGHRAAPHAGYRSGSCGGASRVGRGTDPTRGTGSGEHELSRGVAAPTRSFGCVDRSVQLAGGAFDKDDVVRLQQALQTPQTPQARASLGFALARALEDQADYHAAFRALYKANTLKRRLGNWNAAAARAQVSAMTRAFAELPEAPDVALGEQVIFAIAAAIRRRRDREYPRRTSAGRRC